MAGLSMLHSTFRSLDIFFKERCNFVDCCEGLPTAEFFRCSSWRTHSLLRN